MRRSSRCSLHNLVFLQGYLVLLNSKRSHRGRVAGSVFVSVCLSPHCFHPLPFLRW